MKTRIIETYYRLLNGQNIETHRFLFREFNINRRLTGIVGPRGTGKTTLMLQFIKSSISDIHKALYLSLDNIYFDRSTLIEFVQELYETENRNVFFIDEVHKYKNWNQEIKNIYDSFPDIRIIFSGSSSLDLIKGNYDLSRRGFIYNLPGLSFREYLNFATGGNHSRIEYRELLDNPVKVCQILSDIPKIRGHFKDYLDKGYYPFIFEEEYTYHHRILNIIDKTVFEDIANFYNLKTSNLHNFKKILAYLATIEPGPLSVNNISNNMGLDNKTVQIYINILTETGLLTKITNDKTGSKLLRSSEKAYLNNPNLYFAISNEIGKEIRIGTIREIFFLNMLINSGQKVFHTKKGDFKVSDHTFEIGGKNKKRDQISALKNAWLVKDDILIGDSETIPLYAFGFIY
ncbi:MAG: ATPase [Candidatus Wallbacteria bacterium HGW-Wallbacteria-1]|jgi:hypothetical protein|uniref:ATPase n=1 Tax=Candidatus Wallbacteria bacterium HGW-Wallbacteria-1 TaxID=2013854 RepID=A0A2N1PMM1_9BACT|nr:MAG: ATPase [Candidatus Wallbacteria bacterium HGW-Wallbacteria-1]